MDFSQRFLKAHLTSASSNFQEPNTCSEPIVQVRRADRVFPIQHKIEFKVKQQFEMELFQRVLASRS